VSTVCTVGEGVPNVGVSCTLFASEALLDGVEEEGNHDLILPTDHGAAVGRV